MIKLFYTIDFAICWPLIIFISFVVIFFPCFPFRRMMTRRAVSDRNLIAVMFYFFLLSHDCISLTTDFSSKTFLLQVIDHTYRPCLRVCYWFRSVESKTLRYRLAANRLITNIYTLEVNCVHRKLRNMRA